MQIRAKRRASVRTDYGWHQIVPLFVVERAVAGLEQWTELKNRHTEKTFYPFHGYAFPELAGSQTKEENPPKAQTFRCYPQLSG